MILPLLSKKKAAYVPLEEPYKVQTLPELEHERWRVVLSRHGTIPVPIALNLLPGNVTSAT
jgi:hypothetical protein